MGNAFECVFTALRGMQASREYYLAMCPLRLIPKLFLFDEEELDPALRAQRTINRARVPEMARYILDNPRDYVFSALTASIDGDVKFEPLTPGTTDVGRLTVPMTARFIINDGQHRRAAIEEALKERPELSEETISVVFFIDAGLRRSQQMFADLNRHAIRPTRSIGILYDHRDPLSQLARQLVDEVDVFRGLTELEKTTISNRSRKLFTLSSIYLATRKLLGKSARSPISSEEAEIAREYWSEVAKNIPDWTLAAQARVAPADLRRDTVHAHGVALQALAIAGRDLLAAEPTKWRQRLRAIRKLNWSRSNTDTWEGRAMIGGRVSKSDANVNLTANVIKQLLSLPLKPSEERVEDARSRKHVAA